MVEYVLCWRRGLLGKSPKFEERIVGKESQVTLLEERIVGKESQVTLLEERIVGKESQV